MLFRFNDGGREAAGYKGRTGDCACRSIAIVTGKDYQAVYDDLNYLARDERIGKRKKGKSDAGNGVYPQLIRKYMDYLGWIWTPTMFIGSGCTVHLRDGELPSEGPLLVNVSKHYTAVVDGIIYDTSNPSREGTRCVYGYFQPST